MGFIVKGIHVIWRKLAGGKRVAYVYAWRGGPQIMRHEGPPPIRLDETAQAALGDAVASRGRPEPGTLAALDYEFRCSPEWRQLAATTREAYAAVWAKVPAKWAKASLRIVSDHRFRTHILEWRDAASATPRSANARVENISMLLAWAVARGRIATNVAQGLPKLTTGPSRAHIVWEEDERRRWQDARQPIRDAFNLACLTGLRRGDLLALTWGAVGLHSIVWRTSKRRSVVSVPMLPALAALLDDLRTRRRVDRCDTVLVSSHGRAWSLDGFTAEFIRERTRLGLPAKHFHDCRGSYATQLCLAGLTDQEIARIMGWSEGNIARIRSLYVDTARTVVALGERMKG